MKFRPQDRQDRSHPIDEYSVPDDEEMFAYLDLPVQYPFSPFPKIVIYFENGDEPQSLIEALYDLRDRLRKDFHSAKEHRSSEASTAAENFINISRIIQLRKIIGSKGS
ncbi:MULTISPECIES: hypothetical protein [Sphingomonadaceae]|jgi:hypothetical protein|uniref:hypothetical protein n=1 Tax=Sphingomonadales TaxID=204457 RepID=UPI0011AE86D6|nr:MULTISPECIES: hypothetical protein [Sphingomonadaceae]KAA9009592.1 hypothetical protein F4U94_23120 [Sphingobium limneticum]